MWGRDYHGNTSRLNRDKLVQRSISPEGPEAHTGENDVIGPFCGNDVIHNKLVKSMTPSDFYTTRFQ